MGTSFAFPWEIDLIRALQSAGWIPAWLVRIFSFPGEEIAIVLAIGFVYWCWNKQTVYRYGPGVMLAMMAGPLLKNAVARRRPYMDSEEIECLAPVEDGDLYDVALQGYSFPSMHSSNAVSIYGSVGLAARRKWVRALFFAVPLLVGFSRVYLGNHYPTDVLAGWAIGILALLIDRIAVRFVPSPVLRLAAVLALSAPGLFFCETADFFTCFGLCAGMCLGFLLEIRLVRFEETRSFPEILIRLTVGGVLFFGLNALLKLPFSPEFLSDGTRLSHLVRAGRYLILSFLLIGVYPMLFSPLHRLFVKKEPAETSPDSGTDG